MGFKIFEFLRAKDGQASNRDITVSELMLAAQEYQIRELCFYICVDLIANALGRCEFCTYQGGEEKRGAEYYMWNVEPNVNQNSTAFIHKFVTKLFENGEALIINTRPHDNREAIVIADTYQIGDEYPSKQREYSGVTVGSYTYDKAFKENEVMRIRLNHCNIRCVLNAMYESYSRLISAAMKTYTWENGQHWKVHIDQIAQGGDFSKTFTQMIKEQMKPFIETNGAVLPEFDGYKYEKIERSNQKDTRDIRQLVEDVFDFTARAMNIPAVLINGKVEAASGATSRFLTECIDPICDQIEEEAIRKRYGFEAWQRGDYLHVDSSAILHFDIFENAPNVEKLVGSGAFTINDVRKAAGKAPINEDWANKHYMTLNISDMSQNTRSLDSERG